MDVGHTMRTFLDFLCLLSFALGGDWVELLLLNHLDEERREKVVDMLLLAVGRNRE